MHKRLCWVLGGLLLALALLGCTASAPSSLVEVLPRGDELVDWTPAGDAMIFDGQNLYDLVDGQAEAFFAYGFEQVAVQKYENTQAANLEIEIWQMATPADAYGLFTSSISGTPAAIGNDGDSDPGRRLTFWQDRYFVHTRARQALPQGDLWRAAEAVSGALPTGGQTPDLLRQLPLDGLEERSTLFFHEEISLQDRLWLGGQNLLGLSASTDGVLARYDIDGTSTLLLLVQYDAAAGASTALAALQDSQPNDLVTATSQDNLLGAVFGETHTAAAEALLKTALENR